MFVRKDGTIYFFCSGKCQKNMLGLGRIGRKVRWTRRYVKALRVRTPRRVERPAAAPADVKVAPVVEDRESLLEAFQELPGVGRSMAEALWEAGYTSMEKLKAVDEETLTDVRGIGPATAKKVLGYLKEAR